MQPERLHDKPLRPGRLVSRLKLPFRRGKRAWETESKTLQIGSPGRDQGGELELVLRRTELRLGCESQDGRREIFRTLRNLSPVFSKLVRLKRRQGQISKINLQSRTAFAPDFPFPLRVNRLNQQFFRRIGPDRDLEPAILICLHRSSPDRHCPKTLGPVPCDRLAFLRNQPSRNLDRAKECGPFRADKFQGIEVLRSVETRDRIAGGQSVSKLPFIGRLPHSEHSSPEIARLGWSHAQIHPGNTALDRIAMITDRCFAGPILPFQSLPFRPSGRPFLRINMPLNQGAAGRIDPQLGERIVDPAGLEIQLHKIGSRLRWRSGFSRNQLELRILCHLDQGVERLVIVCQLQAPL